MISHIYYDIFILFFKGGGNDMTYEYDPHEIDV